MGFNFRKSLKIAPGVRLNVTKKGVSSVSVGGKGVRTNFSNKGTKTTVGIPGSGLSYTSTTPKKSRNSTPNQLLDTQDKPKSNFAAVVIIGFVFILFLMFILGN